MAELAPQVLSYSHLKHFSRGDEALLRLKKIASMAKPIMRKRSWTLPVLAEFYPDEPTLLGINENKGARICLRLRYAGDRDQFLPVESVIDTFLHELSHNVHGPHNDKFHALWNSLRSELDDLISKGYTGEGFLGKGQILGGRRVPMHEVQRQMREAAERRRKQDAEQSARAAGSGRRLGGAPPSSSRDIRTVIAGAIESRLNRNPVRQPDRQPQRPKPVSEGCGNATHTDREVTEIADIAVNNGFRTKAEEDEANDAAIARALSDMNDVEDPGIPTAGPGQWVCPQCTLINPQAVRSCQVCDFVLHRP